ncbi:hypothetical protein [Guptibacillus algicola]|uniref:hypothetical protein n=1 Tax=Guptibacillus algicola TaxID=225844 RepID=UPI001CD391A6|nr:hypothetical protein [Alkalihalobacillus algicola]MCA0988719.1 hypothetical protein [Alkalihalobacillus algicola]
MKKFLGTLDQPLEAKTGKEKALTVLSIIGFILLLYAVAFSPFLFRLFLTCLSVGVSLYVVKKIQDFDRVLKGKESGEEDVVPEAQLSFDWQRSERDDTAEAEKELELERINSDKTQLFEELLTKADLDELEKATYREQLRQKETDSNRIKQELLVLKDKIQQVVNEKKNLFIKETPDMKLVAELIGVHDIESSSFLELNARLQEISQEIPQQKRETLQEHEMVNEDFELTRLGYKELMKEVRKLEKKPKYQINDEKPVQ